MKGKFKLAMASSNESDVGDDTSERKKAKDRGGYDVDGEEASNDINGEDAPAEEGTETNGENDSDVAPDGKGDEEEQISTLLIFL